jgi:hypothetical protein
VRGIGFLGSSKFESSIEGEGRRSGLAVAMRWEHRMVSVIWDKTKGDWVARFSAGDIQGFGNALNFLGQSGWELVSVQPYEWRAPARESGYEGTAVE